jgi:hypothetical protein
LKRKKNKPPQPPVWTDGYPENTQQADLSLFMNITVRLALLCMATAGVVLMFIQLYEVPVNVRTVISRTVFAAFFFNVLFIYVKFRFALPALGLILFFYVRASDFLYNLGCLADYLLIYIDGGMLHTAVYASRPSFAVLNRMTSEFQGGLQTALIFCAVMLAFLFAVSARGKFIGSILITTVILIIPAIASQKASYVPSVTLLVCSMFGLYSVWASQEQSFLRSINPARRKKKKPPYIPQIHRHSVNGAAAACLALIAVMTAQVILPVHRARETIEFWGRASDRVIVWLHDISDLVGGGFSSLGHLNIPPLDTSGYMPGGGINASGSLTISNPTISRRPVLNVTLDNNNVPVYLRNGIGSSFDAGHERWSVDGRNNNHMRSFPENFYPEHGYLIFRQKVSNLGFLADSLIGRQRVDVEYLVRTPHVMLPTSLYLPNYKSDSRFNWRGDTILEKRGSNNPQTYTWDVLYPRHNAHLNRAIDSVQHRIFNERALTGAEAAVSGLSGRFEDYIFLEILDGTGGGLSEGALRIFVTDYGLTAEEYLHYLAEYEAMIYEIYLETSESESENIRRFLDEMRIASIASDGLTFSADTGVSGIIINDGERRTTEDLMDLYEIRAAFAGHDIQLPFGSNMTDFEKASFIEIFFKTNFTYSLTVDNHSGDNSLLGNFLFETRSGHCALYATAMTLMLRELGIPARYVTGYVAGGGNAVPQANGRYLHTILERDLHAWVEVYFEGVGWLPFDPTPPIFEHVFLEAETGVPAATTTPVTTTAPVTTTTPVTTTAPAITTAVSPSVQGGEPPAPSESHEESNAALIFTILMIAAITLLIAGITAAVIMFLKGIERSEQRRLARYADLNEPAAAREAYRFMLKLLKMEGLTAAAGETPRKFALRVDEELWDSALTSAIDAALKLEFSRETLTAAEYAKLSEAVKGLYAQAVTRQKRLKRLVRRIIALDIIK